MNVLKAMSQAIDLFFNIITLTNLSVKQKIMTATEGVDDILDTIAKGPGSAELQEQIKVVTDPIKDLILTKRKEGMNDAEIIERLAGTIAIIQQIAEGEAPHFTSNQQATMVAVNGVLGAALDAGHAAEGFDQLKQMIAEEIQAGSLMDHALMQDAVRHIEHHLAHGDTIEQAIQCSIRSAEKVGLTPHMEFINMGAAPASHIDPMPLN